MAISIYNIEGSQIYDIQENQNTIKHEELMQSDYVQLYWLSDTAETIPVGSYIMVDDEKYSLQEPYTPVQRDECTYEYTPKFQSRVMNWDRQITPIYTYEEDAVTVKTREMDWEFTGSPADAMYIVKQAIKNETGEDWKIELSDSLPATISISSQSSSIFSVLNSIASACNTEWWADKKTNTLYLSRCAYGSPVRLEVGVNVQVPSVTSDKEGYFTRFYAFGSTRNISQTDLEGGASVNKRLTLDPAKYPYGYKDIRSGLKAGEIFVKVLYFDDVYPSSKLTISDVRARLKYRLDNAGNKIVIGGTEEEPVYEQYAIWYFQIEGFTFDKGSIIDGKNLSVSFESGQLASRDFELIYHERGGVVNDSNDITPFEVKAGDYEIVIDETSGQIIPGVAYIIPQEGDSIILYNILMPSEYTASAQGELERRLDEAIAEQASDSNTYQLQSNPVAFDGDGTILNMGQSVTYVNGENTLETRVMMSERRLDLPCYQTLKVGNKIIKGNTQQLKDEVASANQNIDIINAFNELSASLSQAYANAQREMIEGFAAIKNLWQLREDDNGNQYAYTQFDVLSKGGMTAYSAGTAQVPSIVEGIPFDNKTIWYNKEKDIVEVIGGTSGGGSGDIDATKLWQLLGAPTSEPINISHLTTALSGYATTEQLNSKWTQDNAKISHWDEAYTKSHEHGNKSVLDGITSAKVSNWDSAYGWGDHNQEGYAHLANEETFTGLKHFTKGLSVGTAKKKIYESNGVVYIDGDLAVTGGVTAYALGGRSISSIMDGVVTDNTTIRVNPTTKALEVIGGTGGGEADSVEWNNIKNKPTWITATNPSYTKSESDNKYITALGTSGNNLTYTKNGTTTPITIPYATNAGTLSGKSLHTSGQNPYGKIPFVGTDGVMEFGKIIDFHTSSTDSRDYAVRLQATNTDNSYTINLPSKSGTIALLTDNVASATKLETARYIWGKAFNGTKDISGDMTNVGRIDFQTGSSINAPSLYDFVGVYKSNSVQRFAVGGLYVGSTYTDTENVPIGTVKATQYIVNGLLISKDTDGSLVLGGNVKIKGNMLAEGGVTAYAAAGSEEELESYFLTSSLAKQNLNANNLTSPNMVYYPIGDMSTWTDNTFTNFPSSKPVGGFTLMVLKEGNYLRQIYSSYNDSHLYQRYQYYSGGVKWSSWIALANVADKLDSLDFNSGSSIKAPSGFDFVGFYKGTSGQRIAATAAYIGSSYGNASSVPTGSVYATEFKQTSDIRKKNKLNDIIIATDKIASAPIFRFSWKDTDRIDVGSSAQYWKEVLPDLVSELEGTLSMNYSNIALVCVVSLAKQMQTEITKLNKEIVFLKNKIKQIGG